MTPSDPVQPVSAIVLQVLFDAAACDPAVFRQLMVIFLDTAGPMFARLETALRSGRHAECVQASHALAGATMLVGAARLTATLQEIERQSRLERQADLTVLLPLLRQQLQLVMQQVEAGLAALDTPAGIARWSAANS